MIIVDCPRCGDDAHPPAPCARPSDPDYGEFECSSCGHVFKPFDEMSAS